MKRIKTVLSVFLAVMLALACCPVAFAANVGTVYYVDSVNGDDANSGKSESVAWKTTEKASSVEYSAGDKVLFKAGGYFVGTFAAKGSGTKENPITLGAYGDVDALGKPMLTVEGENAVVEITDVSNWTVDGLDVSAPSGKGIYITCTTSIMNGITVKNCSMHDIFKQRSETQVKHLHSAIGVQTVFGQGRLSDVVIGDIDIRDCGFGIYTGRCVGAVIPEYDGEASDSYARNVLYENITMNNVYYDGIVMGGVIGLTVRNCTLLNTALYDDFYTAPTWMHYAKDVTVENCEIAGSTNTLDGMAVDFDGWTTDSTYQYIYSHDNVRFMANCIYDDETQNRNCTVRYCLSVNDNKSVSNSGPLGGVAVAGMDNFKFYNNTVVDGGNYSFAYNKNSVVANNIFVSSRAFGEMQTVRKYAQAGLHKFTGEFTNNCFVNYAVPPIAKNNAVAIPGFVGGDYYDVNSYRLSASSPLIGKGIQVEDDMGEHDFYGTPPHGHAQHRLF